MEAGGFQIIAKRRFADFGAMRRKHPLSWRTKFHKWHRRECPLWVRSGHCAGGYECPLWAI